MTKKTFKTDGVLKGGFSSLLRDDEKQAEENEFSNSSQNKSVKKESTKITLKLDADLLKTIKEIAYYERISVTAFFAEALQTGVEKYKSQNK